MRINNHVKLIKPTELLIEDKRVIILLSSSSRKMKVSLEYAKVDGHRNNIILLSISCETKIKKIEMKAKRHWR